MQVSIPAAVEFQERNFVKNPRTIAILVLAVGLTFERSVSRLTGTNGGQRWIRSE